MMPCVTNDMWIPLPMPEVAELSQICERLAHRCPDNVQTLLHAMALTASLFNVIPNVVSFIKDVRTRYLVINMILVRHCEFKTAVFLLGEISANIFPSALGLGYAEQDIRALREGVMLRNQLKMHLCNDREHGWYLTQKLALRDIQGQVIGMAGISYDLQGTRACYPTWQRLTIVDDHTRSRYHRPIAVEELTVLNGMSVTQIERYCKRTFHLAPHQTTHEVRLEKTTELLAGDTPITDIALQCDYTDHGTFNRQFKTMTGSTPHDFRITLAGQDTLTVLISSSKKKRTTKQLTA